MAPSSHLARGWFQRFQGRRQGDVNEPLEARGRRTAETTGTSVTA
jgi:hypothetical protein